MPETNGKSKKIAIDIAAIMEVCSREGKSTLLTERYLYIREIPNARIACLKITERIGAKNMSIFCLAGPNIAERYRHWLQFHNFMKYTGIDWCNVHFFETEEEMVRWFAREDFAGIITTPQMETVIAQHNVVSTTWGTAEGAIVVILEK